MILQSAARWLEVWERGLENPAWMRPLLTLAAGHPEIDPSVMAEWSVGRRDAELLTLRASAFGKRFNSLASCPRCSERIEASFGLEDVQAAVPASDNLLLNGGSVEADGWIVNFRLPNTLDLAAAGSMANLRQARDELLRRCVVSVTLPGTNTSGPVPPEGLSPAADAAVTEAMNRLEPHSAFELELSCPTCRHTWEASFDIGDFFWSELDAWARRLLRDVHSLARAYGWREADILALSPSRRQVYLELLAGG